MFVFIDIWKNILFLSKNDHLMKKLLFSHHIIIAIMNNKYY